MFVHLKLKSIYSLLEGAIFPNDLAKRCLDFGMPAVAIADRGNLFGALEFSDILADHGGQQIFDNFDHLSHTRSFSL